MENALKLTEDNIHVVSRYTDISIKGLHYIDESNSAQEEATYFMVENLNDPLSRKVRWTQESIFKRHYEFIGPENLTKFIPVKTL